MLPEPWLSVYAKRQTAIRQRLQDFANIPPAKHFYELAFCLLTPQSSAANAELTIHALERDGFFKNPFDPTTYLRDPKHYIRFHNTKAKRLLAARESFNDLAHHLTDTKLAAEAKREIVLAQIKGLGMKEASHFLRNIGVRNLAILDRHIFKHLKRLGVIKDIPKSVTKKRYLEIEKKWHKYADKIGIPLDELDLLFWSMETGEIRK